MDGSAVNNLFQYTAYFGVSTDLVNYLKVELHDGSKAAANSVTNWQGAGSITPLVAAFLADSFLGRFWTITLFLLISVAVHTSLLPSTTMHSFSPLSIDHLEKHFRPGHVQGYGVVTASAWASSSNSSSTAPFYAGLYLIALGGALQPVMSSFGADQFDASASPSERARQSSFFNWFYLSVNAGSLVGGTLLVWVQASHGWRLGYGIPALLSALAVALFLAGAPAYRRHQPPGGSPLTRVAQVVVAAVRNWDAEVPQDDAAGKLYECGGEDGMSVIQGSRRLAHTDQFR